MTPMPADPRPLIAHVVYRFDTGGLENGVANLINCLPADQWRHAVIALTTITDFRKRVERDDVEFIALDKNPGHGAWLYPRMTRLLRELKPSIVHTRNLAALEMMVPAWWAGVPARIHGEHGREGADLVGNSLKYKWIRKAFHPFVSHYVALSGELEAYVKRVVGVPAARVSRITNGVDTERFHTADSGRVAIMGCPFKERSQWLIGTVGRMQPVKDQVCLVQAFIEAVRSNPESRARLRLILVGDGPLRVDAQTILENAGMIDLAWLPGARDDVPSVLRGLDCFVLPSRSEGISNTILEAMASGLPVIATAVGGNPELVEAGRTGELVPAADHEALAECILAYARNPGAARAAGRAGRERVVRNYSLDGMVARYDALYTRLLRAASPPLGAASAASAVGSGLIATRVAPTDSNGAGSPVGAASAADHGNTNNVAPERAHSTNRG